MKKSVFDPTSQIQDNTSKIVAGLERISESFRVLLWDHAKVIGLSPIQIQILIFIRHHTENMCNVSHLAKEFNVTKPTISDAIRTLEKKELIEKNHSNTDKRAFSICLSSKGKKTVKSTENFADPIKKIFLENSQAENDQFFTQLSHVIYKLNQAGVLNIQRTCFACRYYEKTKSHHYCRLLDKAIVDHEIRIDCPEFQS